MSSLHDFGALGPIGPEAHGSRACYRAGCHCLPCRSANAAYVAQRRRARAAGEAVAMGHTVQSYRVRRYLRSLLAEGFTLHALARRVQLHRETLGIHARRIPTDPTGQVTVPKMRVATAVRILALYRRLMGEGETL